jgi:phosphatidylserine decarboxylase
MAKSLQEWLDHDVEPLREETLSRLSQYHFFRDPARPTYSNTGYFFAPADGIILYQKSVAPDEALLDIKGKPYSLREAMRDKNYSATSLVIGIFMTFFDVHVNRIPFPGRLTYRSLDAIDTLNHPMLPVEKSLLEELRLPAESPEYLRHNQRVLNRVDSAVLGQPYYLLQIADYDVDCIVPFSLKQNEHHEQCQRFSQIRYGSQVDLIIPLSRWFDFVPVQSDGFHVEAGIDPVVGIRSTRGEGFIR